MRHNILTHVFSTLAALCLSATPLLAQEIRIAALGDSLTQGYGLFAEEGFTAQLQTWLEENDVDAQIVNAGVSGDTTSGGLARAAWTLTPDVHALILALGGNDALRGVDPTLAKANLAAILDLAQERDLPVLLIGITAPNNFGLDYKQEFEAIYPSLAAQYDAQYIVSFLGALLDPETGATIDPNLMQADRLHPNAEGFAMIVADIGPEVARLAARVD